MRDRPTILICIPYPADDVALLRDRYDVIHAPTRQELTRVLDGGGHARIRGVVTNAAAGLAAAAVAAMPGLEIVLTQGAGYDGLDLDALAGRGIVLANGSGANATSVADHAMALMLAIMRNVVPADRAMRAGDWAGGRGLRPTPTGKRLGILGLGTVGMQVARRGRGFDMAVSYHNRSPRQGCDFRYHPNPVELARASDVLVVCCPGGPDLRHVVNASVLHALGPGGFLVNVSRGGNVDQDALVDALHDGAIAGAALDVLDGEPDIPAALRTAPNLVMTPHIAGSSPDARAEKSRRVAENLDRHFSGQPVLSRVV